MKNLLFFALIVLQTACAEVVPQNSNDAQNSPVATSDDLRILAGNGWKGHLQYLDYSSGKISQIPVEIQVGEPRGRSLEFAIRYPGESQYNSKEKIKISRDGRKLDGAEIVARNKNDRGDLVLVTSDQGRDDNRPADFRVTYVVGSTSFEISKEVRFLDESDYFLRNQYSMSR